MAKALRYLSISHKTATVTQRELFYMAPAKKQEVITHVCSKFPDISGLLVLVTCNRTEIYFEGEDTSAGSLLNTLCTYLLGEPADKYAFLFTLSNQTEKSVAHLLDVSSGLVSKVIGDAEIIYQLKKAYQIALQNNLQGSLLERAMQLVFKTHKRIQNETTYRDGTTSVAYKALKMINDTYGRELAKKKNILFIGAGDIVKQLFKYNAKFGFENIHISNRTKSKALLLTNRYLGHWFEWENVLKNNFQNIDIVISAVSNCHGLITTLQGDSKPKLLIDLALPGNIVLKTKNTDPIQFYDIDAISHELEQNKEKRRSAIAQVIAIKESELIQFKSWHYEAPLRALLSEYKIAVNQKIKVYIKTHQTPYDTEKIKLISSRIMRELVKQPHVPIAAQNLETLVAQHMRVEQ